MEILKVMALLLIGGLILSYGASLFVSSSSHFARRLGISPVIIGLTVVAFGTSAPELAVNVLAVIQGNSDIAMGNVVGSNIFNVAFILGICALLRPLAVSAQLIRIDIPVMVVSSLLLFLFARDFSIDRTEGLVLLLGIILYNVLQVRLAIKGKNADSEFEKEFSVKGNPLKDTGLLLMGLGGLILGAKLFVDGAVDGARLLGLSETLIGLTIIAAGTSLPEVATSVAATMKGERDIAIGNVVGSNIFNILGVIGISGSLGKSLSVNPHIANVDLPMMVGFAFLCLPFSYRHKELKRSVGAIFFMGWLAYTAYLIATA